MTSLTGGSPTWEGKPKLRTTGEGDMESTYMYMYHAIKSRGGVCIVLNTVLLSTAVR